MTDDAAQLADVFAEVVAARRRGLALDAQLTVSEWADRHRILPAGSSEPGPWRTARVPYLKDIMDALSTASPVERVVFMKAAQTGGTEAALNAIGYWIDHAPGVILAVWPSIDMVRKNSRIRIDPLIEDTPALRRKVASPKAKDSGNTVVQKEFAGGSLNMTGANSATGLRSTPARYLVLDEVDGYPDRRRRGGRPGGAGDQAHRHLPRPSQDPDGVDADAGRRLAHREGIFALRSAAVSSCRARTAARFSRWYGPA